MAGCFSPPIGYTIDAATRRQFFVAASRPSKSLACRACERVGSMVARREVMHHPGPSRWLSRSARAAVHLRAQGCRVSRREGSHDARSRQGASRKRPKYAAIAAARAFHIILGTGFRVETMHAREAAQPDSQRPCTHPPLWPHYGLITKEQPATAAGYRVADRIATGSARVKGLES